MKRSQWLPAAIVFAVLASVPLWLHDAYLLQLALRVVLFAVLGMAWNLVGGYAGQLSLGHVAYFGIGAYGMSLLHERFGLSPWLGILLSAALAGTAALIIGSITFRLRGPYFTLSTIATAEIIRLVALNAKFTHGAIGLLAPALFSEPFADQKLYLSAVPLLGVAFAFTAWLHGSRFGYSLRAIRESEDTAMAVGINPALDKLKALVPSALLTAVAGAMFASSFQFIGPDSVLAIDISVQAALIAMLGGAGTAWGPIIGSGVLTLSAEMFKSYFEQAHLLIYGLLLVLVVLFLPGGVVSILQRRRRSVPAAQG